MVYLPGPVSPFVDRADLAAQDKTGRFPGAARIGQSFGQPGSRVEVLAQALFERITAFSGVFELLPQFRKPEGMRAVPGSQEVQPLDPGPAIQVRGAEFGAGGTGEPRMDMEIRFYLHRMSISIRMRGAQAPRSARYAP